MKNMPALLRSILIGAAIAGLSAVMVLAQNGAAPAPGEAPTEGRGALPNVPKSLTEEYLLLGDAMRGAGEPMVAVDPTNPKNIIAVAQGSINQGAGPGLGGNGRVARSTITWLAVTHDGGVNWKVGEVPILGGNLQRCPDSFADVTKDGVFIAGCEPREVGDKHDEESSNREAFIGGYKHICDMAEKANVESVMQVHPNTDMNLLARTKYVNEDYPPSKNPLLYGADRTHHYIEIMRACTQARMEALGW